MAPHDSDLRAKAGIDPVHSSRLTAIPVDVDQCCLSPVAYFLRCRV